MPIKNVQEENVVTIRSNELEFMYVISRMELEDGSVECKKAYDTNPMRHIFERKKEGTYRYVTEVISNMSKLGDVQFVDPRVKEITYFYRGKDSKKNMFYEVKSRQGKPYQITIYEYLPSEKETNPYNLPDLDGKSESQKVTQDQSAKTPTGPSTQDPEKKDPNFYNFEMRLETRGKYIPKDVHLFQAGTELSLLDMAKVTGETRFSVKERLSKWSLRPVDGGRDYGFLELKHKGVDEVGTKLVVPVQFSIDQAKGRNIIGSISDERVSEKGKMNKDVSNHTVSLILTDHDLEWLRLDARKSIAGDALMSVSHSRALAPNERMTLMTGYRETKDGNHAGFVGLSHAKRIKENTSMILDVRYDSQSKTTLLWQVQKRF